MHLTIRLCQGLPSLRRAGARAAFRSLLEEARRRGVRTVAFCCMANHLHWVVLASSPESLRDATRYVFGLLARALNRMWQRPRGKVFADRYHSTIGNSVRQAWNMMNYVLRNPVSAHCRGATTRCDPFLGVNLEVLVHDRFMRSIFGVHTQLLRALLLRMTREPVPYTSLSSRLQTTLPGLEPSHHFMR